MKAIVVTPGERDSARLREVPSLTPGPGEALVRTIRVGVDGTDDEINQGLYGDAPPGGDYLVLGHESLGRVERVEGRSEVVAGDLVVATVRRPDGCPNCASGQTDMCLWGDYTERGIKGRHGFLSEYFVESAEYLVKVPERLEPLAVLLEPLSIAEKAIRQVFEAQRRLLWQPRQAVVLGTGSLGLLCALLLRLRGLEVAALDRTPKPVQARVLAAVGAHYLSTRETAVLDLPARFGRPDLIVEATGNARVAFEAMQVLGTNGALVLTGLSGAEGSIDVPGERINREFVLGNKLLLGSVNANRRDFEQGIVDLAEMEARWPGVLGQFITTRLSLAEWERLFARPREDVKTVMEFGGAHAAQV